MARFSGTPNLAQKAQVNLQVQGKGEYRPDPQAMQKRQNGQKNPALRAKTLGEPMQEPAPLLIGVGHAISDLVLSVGEAFLADHGLTKGATLLVDEAQSRELLTQAQATGATPTLVAGGSVANTLWGVGALGIATALWGRLGKDANAEAYRGDLKKNGVKIYEGAIDQSAPPETSPSTSTSTITSGRCLVFITPDSERTMATYLGTAGDLLESALPTLPFSSAKIIYLEGYLWESEAGRTALMQAAQAGHKAGAQVAFSLSDSFCVARHRNAFLSFIEQEVDVLFANEQEAALLAGMPDKEQDETTVRTCLAWLGERVKEVALTRSDKGALVGLNKDAEEKGQWRIAPVAPPKLADVTGAGDFFAAGYLWARLAGLSAPVAGAQGARIASAVLGVAGARPAEALHSYLLPSYLARPLPATFPLPLPLPEADRRTFAEAEERTASFVKLAS